MYLDSLRFLGYGKRAFSVAIALGACLLSSVCTAESFKARVVDVSAGDIFEIRHAGELELVVLYGVEAPLSKTLAGQYAKQFASDRVLDTRVTVQVVEKRDDLTYVEIRLNDGTNLGHLMLRKGVASWNVLSAPKDEGLKELERLAREERLGLWAHPSADVEPLGDEIEELVVDDGSMVFPRPGTGYRVLERRVLTDEKGARTLVLRGNGKTVVGFEAAVERIRREEYQAYLADLEWERQENLRLQQKAEAKAAAEAALQLEQAQEVELERLVLENRYLLDSKRGRPTRVWSSKDGWDN